MCYFCISLEASDLKLVAIEYLGDLQAYSRAFLIVMNMHVTHNSYIQARDMLILRSWISQQHSSDLPQRAERAIGVCGHHGDLDEADGSNPSRGCHFVVTWLVC